MRKLFLHGKYGSAIGRFAMIDDGDFLLVSKIRWSSNKLGYVLSQRRGKGMLHLSRLLLKAPKSKVVDHINGNPLDNRRKNLRLCTHGQNQCNRLRSKNNTSGYKGVFWETGKGKWTVQIYYKYKRYSVGRFASKIEAAKAYDEAARRLHGTYAKTNFPKKKAR